MADENTTTDVTDEGSATDTAQDDAASSLNDAGKKALSEERKARTAAERTAKEKQKQLDELTSKLQQYEDAKKSDLDKLTDRATAAEKAADEAQGRLLRYEVAASKKLPAGFAARLQGATREELEADADALLETLGEQQRRQTPNYDGGVRQGAPAPTDMNALIRQKAGLG